MEKMNDKIKKLRRSKGWTQTELAKRLGTSQKVITSYETGAKKPPIKRLPDLAAVFGITVDELIDSQPIQIHEDTPHIHKNSRSAKMQELFEKLPPEEQRVILKQVKTLTSNNTK
jgi:transcriptional regulator with XRE-family HTH domain